MPDPQWFVVIFLIIFFFYVILFITRTQHMVHSPVKFTANIMKLPPQQQHNNRIYMAFMIRMSVRTQSGSVWREFNAIQHF